MSEGEEREEALVREEAQGEDEEEEEEENEEGKGKGKGEGAQVIGTATEGGERE